MNNIGHIVIMGNCSIDNIIKADGTYHQHVCGGNSFHAAMAAGIIADNVSILVNVPENFPQRFIDDLNQHGIDTSLIKRREKSVIWEELFIYRANGDREDGLFVNIKENLEGCCVSKEKLLSLSVPSSEKIYCYDDFRADYYPDIDTIPKEWKVQSLHIAPQLLAVHKKAISTTIPIKTLDPGHYLKDLSYSEILDIVSDCTVFAPSKKELRYIFPTTDIVESVIKLGADSNTNIVCKNGKNGAVVFDAADKRCYEVGIFPEEKVVPSVKKKCYCGKAIYFLIVKRLAADFSGHNPAVFGHYPDASEDLKAARGHRIKNFPESGAFEADMDKAVLERKHRHDVIDKDISLGHIDSDTAEIDYPDIDMLPRGLLDSIHDSIDKKVGKAAFRITGCHHLRRMSYHLLHWSHYWLGINHKRCSRCNGAAFEDSPRRSSVFISRNRTECFCDIVRRRTSDASPSSVNTDPMPTA